MIRGEDGLQPHEITLLTRFPVVLRERDVGSLLLAARRVHAVPARSGTPPRLYAHLRVEDALALGYDQEEPGELTRALLGAFPELAGQAAQVEKRVRHLAWEHRERLKPPKGREPSMRVEDLSLDTEFEAVIRIEDTPPNERTLQGILGQLERMGIHARSVRDGVDVVLKARITIEEALRLGYNRHVPEELALALADVYPSLAGEPLRLRHRIRELEWRYEGLRRAG